MDRWAGWWLAAMFTAWYVSAGIQIDRYQESVFLRRCPGHVTANHAFPWARPVMVAFWPLGVPTGLFMEHVTLVCDRWDAWR